MRAVPGGRSSTCAREVDSLVSRTFARAQTPFRRAWLTAARRAVPGDRPTPSPRPVLTATPDFVSRHRSARRGRAPLRALFCPVRGLPPPVAVSSTARHAQGSDGSPIRGVYLEDVLLPDGTWECEDVEGRVKNGSVAPWPPCGAFKVV